MVNTRNVNMKTPVQSGMPGLLSASILGAFLFVSTTPTFADANSDQMKEMENKLHALQNDMSQMAAGMAGHSGESDGLQIHGFMDVGFSNNSQADPIAYPKGFNVGSLSFYLTPHFGNKVKALVEPNFEVTPEGAIATDLERLQIGYTFSDTATGWLGRFHTPYGFWNTGFHHGAQMQTSVVRPRFLDFEDKGGILPAHMVGLWGTGKVRAGEGKFTYDVFVGNGPKIAMADSTIASGSGNLGTLDINQAGDNNHQAMVGFNVGYEFSGSMEGLRLAAHSLRGDVDDNFDPAFVQPNKTELNMVGGSLVYLGNNWELMTELYRFKNKDKSGLTGEYNSAASYLQIGRAFGNLTPYIRKEIANLDQQDNYFNMQASGQSYTRYVGGMKYDLDQKASLKIELHYSNFADGPGRVPSKYRSLYAQYAIRF
jgi:hypothetical protein